MEHTEIRRNLSAYLDNAVSPDEKAEIEAHLAGCGTCRGVLADLERTVAHLKSLPEAEPPPWLTARIMARVRDAAEHQPGFWRRLFPPFPAKLPLQALALVFLCVTGYYLARTNAPLLQLTPPPPANREEASPSPSISVTPVPHHAASAPPKAPAQTPRAPSRMPGAASQRQEETSDYAPPPQAQGPAPREAAPLPYSPPPQAAAPATTYSLPAPDSGADDEAIRARREAESLLRRDSDSASKAMMQKRAMSGGTGYSTQTYGASVPGAAPRESWVEPPQEPEQVERPQQAARPVTAAITLRVNEPGGAVKAIEDAATRSGGRIVRRAYGEARHLLLVRVDASKAPELMERLKRIGTLQKSPQLPAGDAGMVELTIRW